MIDPLAITVGILGTCVGIPFMFMLLNPPKPEPGDDTPYW
jgi:hypothetical protein